MTPRYLIFETTFFPHANVVGWRLYSSRFLVNICISADLSLEISSLCSVYHFSMAWSVFCSVLRMAAVKGPCIIIIMSSAYTTILTFGVMESSAITSLLIIFHKVGSETDPCGQPLVTRLELIARCAHLESPALICKYLGDNLASRAGRGFPGARRCRRRLLYRVLGSNTSVQFFCNRRRVLRLPL